MANYATFQLVEYIDQNNIPYLDIKSDFNGNIILVQDNAAILQNVQTALSLWYSEYQYDTTLGVDYSNILGNPNINDALLFTEIKSVIYNVQGVVSIGNIIVKRDTASRKATITVYIQVDANTNNFIAVSTQV